MRTSRFYYALVIVLTATPFLISIAGEINSHANVIGVSVNGSRNGYEFSVTIASPDIGCKRYANWWEVLTEDGQLLYRRVLVHSHVGEQPFTRSGGPVSISENANVIVRAHLFPDGYGGQAMAGNVVSGFKSVTLPRGFAQSVDKSAPKHTECAF